MDSIFPIIAVTAATFGWLAGYFLRGRLRPTILICTITPVILQAVILFFLTPAGYVKEDIYFVHCLMIPFLLLTVPCLTSGVLTALLVNHTKRKACCGRRSAFYENF